jgi:hypothetical protein
VRLRIIAPSAQGPWTLRLENEGAHPARVPADVRLLRLSVESGDTLAKGPKVQKPVTCAVPPALRPDGFPEIRALLLAPGDAYVETFDPRLFCFGKDAKALAGGTLVRARYGWEVPRGTKKPGPPYAVESTDYPATVAPQKELVAPSLVLSYMPPDVDEPAPEAKEDDNGEASMPPRPPSVAPVHGTAPPADHEADKPPEPAVVDENAPRLALTTTSHVDAGSGLNVAVTVTATNDGHRPMLAAIRARMVGFRIEGPDGVVHCSPAAPTRALPREGFQTLRPGGSTSLTVLVEEACGQALFRRPGLYKVTPSLVLGETGAEIGLAAFTGAAKAKDATLVRIAAGSVPFYPGRPRLLRPEGEPVDAPAP